MSSKFSEICLKLGYFTNTSIEKSKNKKCKDIYRINFSEKRKITKFSIRKRNIKQKDYKGKVYCVTVPNGFIITRRNGKITIQGNSDKIHNITQELEYIGKEILDGLMLNQALLNGEASGYNSAQVGVEVLIRRLDNWRNKLSKWVEKNIFLPIAMMQGFVDKEKSKEYDKPKFLYPKLKWNDLNLRDNSNKIQILMQGYDKQLISGQTILEELDLDYDTEVRRIREEQALVSQAGMFMGGPGAMGSMGGPMGDMGGGMMGGPSPTELGGMPMGGGMGGPMGDMGGMGGAYGRNGRRHGSSCWRCNSI